jgi:hypothetical protein
MPDTCTLVVLMEMNSSSVIWRLVRPSARRRSDYLAHGRPAALRTASAPAISLGSVGISAVMGADLAMHVSASDRC